MGNNAGRNTITRTFASLENERHAFPSWIVDPESCRGKRRADRVVWDRVIVEITGLAVCSYVLTKQRVLPFDRWDSPEYLDLSVTGVSD